VLCVPPYFGTIFIMTKVTTSYKYLLGQFPRMTIERGIGMLRVLARKLRLGMNEVEELLCCMGDKDSGKETLAQAQHLFSPKSHRVAWISGCFSWVSYESGWKHFQPSNFQKLAGRNRWLLQSVERNVKLSFSMGGETIACSSASGGEVQDKMASLVGQPDLGLRPETSKPYPMESKEGSHLYYHTLEENSNEEWDCPVRKLKKKKRKELGMFKVGIHGFEQHGYKTRHILTNRVPTWREISDSFYTNNKVWVSLHLVKEVRTLLGNVHGMMLGSSLSASDLNALHEQYDKLMIRSQKEISMKGSHCYYASLCHHDFWKDRFGMQFKSPITYFGKNSVLRDGKLYFDNKKAAADYFSMTVILHLASKRLHTYLGRNRYVVLQKMGTLTPSSLLCVLFQYNKEVWLGHPDDNFQCRTRVPVS
jgi:hypothetical protein